MFYTKDDVIKAIKNVGIKKNDTIFLTTSLGMLGGVKTKGLLNINKISKLILEALKKELGSRGINVNSIAPGYIETEMTESLAENIKKDLFNKIPLNRFGTSEEVALLATFLVSENASYVSGQIINLETSK